MPEERTCGNCAYSFVCAETKKTRCIHGEEMCGGDHVYVNEDDDACPHYEESE